MCDYQQRSSVEVNQEKFEETEGFDVQAGLTWIYPTNYPLREYQYKIIEKALFQNTLVNLPTGLGKTFIAAVIMYNYYRWYPTGKIIFMAPTRPLVKQQIDACYNIMAFPKDVTAELTGTNKISVRNDIWMDKRVFFVTPQVLQNDLESNPELPFSIKCIVFDEAHKARGNYAYCEVIKKIKNHAKHFRVLALSATPGNSINDVGEVINTLMISNLEYRTEESEDVKPYVFRRKLETIVVPLDEKLKQVRNDYLEVLEKYSRTLLKYKIIQGNYGNLTKGAIFRIKREYQEKSKRDPHYREVTLTLNICISLYHANELLIRHGLRGFLSYFEEHINDPLLRNNDSLIKIMEDVRSYLGPTPVIERLPDGSFPDVPSNIMFGHPKFYRLRDILISHFNNNDESSKVIVFFEYRDSVKEAFLILLQARPIIKPEMFVGQKSGLVTQKMQLRVIKTFRDGFCNTLLSTSIGEEGLDVGEVDLIICFDISNKSPIRMVQRMGRTGRKREGQVVILVTEGKEQQTLNDCLFHKNNMKNWAGSRELMKNFFVDSPRMVPREIHPQCMKMQMTVLKPTILKNNCVKSLIRKTSDGSNSTFSGEVEMIEITEKIPDMFSLFDKSYSDMKNFEMKPYYGNHIEHQRTFQHSSKIGASDGSKLFVNLMKFADAKRFNIPLSQETQLSHKNMKQGDIRNMFVIIGTKNGVTTSQADFMTQASPLNTQKELSSDEIKYREFHNKLHEEISIYLAIQQSTKKECNFCKKGYECDKYKVKNDLKFIDDLDEWITPDSLFFQDITAESLDSYMKSKLQSKDDGDSTSELIDKTDLSKLFSDEEIDQNTVKKNSFCFNLPKSFENLIDKYHIPSTVRTLDEELPDKSYSSTKSWDTKESDKQTADHNASRETCKDRNLNSVLSFFKLDKIEDIFELNETMIDCDVEEEMNNQREPSPVLRTQISQSKKIVRKNNSTEMERSSSPVLDSSVLCRSQNEIFLNGRLSLDIIDTSVDEKNLLKEFSQKNVEKNENDPEVNCSLSTNSDEENLLGLFSMKKKPETSISKNNKNFLGLDDIFEILAFGLTIDDINNKENEVTQNQSIPKENIEQSLNHSNIFNMNNFAMLIKAESTRVEENNENKTIENSIKNISPKNETNMTLIYNQSKHEEQDAFPEIHEFCDLSIFGLIQYDEKVKSKHKKTEQPLYGSTDNKSDQTLSNGVANHMGTKNCSIQKQSYKCISHLSDIIQVSESNNTKILQKKTKNKSDDQKSNQIQNATESNHHNDSDVLIIEDSPVKDDVVDLTQSPKVDKKKSPKRKILSQMTISQILSLTEKPTQSISSSLKPISTMIDENNKNPSSKHEVNSANAHETTKEHQNTRSRSVLENSMNFTAYEKSSQPSPLFKKPIVYKTIMDEIKNERKNYFPTKPFFTSESISNKSIEHDEDPNYYSRSSPKFSNSILDINSGDEFETTFQMNSLSKNEKKSNSNSPTMPKKKVRKKKVFNFIEEEAEISIRDRSISDDESDEDGSFDDSFVDDETQNLGNNTQIHVNYLQSIRSPKSGSRFKMPKTLLPVTDDIFSQPTAREELNSYVIDSFCVDTEDINEQSQELSELEILEQKLKKKKRKEIGRAVKGIKRKRMRMIISDSD